MTRSRKRDDRMLSSAMQILQSGGRQIPDKTSDDLIVRAICGDGAIDYDFTVTVDEFDRDDNWGPGHYQGIAVPFEVAERWDVGITACKAQKIGPRSAEGLSLRLNLAFPDGVPPASQALVTEYLSSIEAAKLAEQQKYAGPIAEILANRAEILRLMPHGMRKPTKEEYDAAWKAVHNWQDRTEDAPILLRNKYHGMYELNWSKAGKVALREATGTDFGERLPPMPGNEEGYTGWTAIHHWRGLILVYNGVGGIAGVGA